MGIFRAQPQLAPEALADLEGALQSSFHPVRPSQEFVKTLHHRLVEPSRTVLESSNGALSLVVVGFGLLAGVLILLLGKRSVIFALLAVLAFILPRLKRQEPGEQVITLA